MLSHEDLTAVVKTLPQPFRSDYFQERNRIRARLHDERYGTRIRGHIDWHDPEFVARCAVLLAELQQKVQNQFNRLASGD
jgi:hypothetical protein